MIASNSQKYATKILGACGSTHRILLDAHDCDRKPINLSGFYVYQNDDAKTGEIVIEDLSFGGLKFRMCSFQKMIRDDLLYIQFILDDDWQTCIQEKVRVKNTYCDIVGVSFTDHNKINQKLMRYLFR